MASRRSETSDPGSSSASAARGDDAGTALDRRQTAASRVQRLEAHGHGRVAQVRAGVRAGVDRTRVARARDLDSPTARNSAAGRRRIDTGRDARDLRTAHRRIDGRGHRNRAAAATRNQRASGPAAVRSAGPRGAARCGGPPLAKKLDEAEDEPVTPRVPRDTDIRIGRISLVFETVLCSHRLRAGIAEEDSECPVRTRACGLHSQRGKGGGRGATAIGPFSPRAARCRSIPSSARCRRR